MTAPHNKPVPDDVLARFAAYHRACPTWGSLFGVMAAGLVRNSDVKSCLHYALWVSDSEGVFLADVILGCGKSQRRSLPGRVARIEAQGST